MPATSPASDRESPVHFTGVPAAGLDFLAELDKNNERIWFRSNHERYRTQLREPLLLLAAALNERLGKSAPEYVTPPGRAITSINRDLRYRREGTPTYKTWLALAFRRSGATPGGAGSLYVSVSPAEVLVRCGLPMPAPETTRTLRAHLVEAYGELQKILRRRGILNAFGSIQGQRLKRVPGDVPADHPAPELLQYRSLYVETRLPVEACADAKFVTEVVRRFRMALPLVRLIDRALLGAPADTAEGE